MSFDLYFRAADPVPVAALRAHFEARPHYELTHQDATYDNPATGVHFQWWFGEPAKEGDIDPEDPAGDAQATLSVNFNRPSSFIHEAAIEAAAFADAFAMQMIDVQGDCVARPYDGQAFSDSYRQSAQQVTAGMIAHAGTTADLRLPRAELDRIWNWNFRKEEHYEALGDDLFFPTIMVFDVEGEARSGFVWGDGVPTCAPRTDGVFVLRSDSAPKTGFFRKRQDLAEWMPFDDWLAEFGDVFRPSDRFGGTWACTPTDGTALFERLGQRSTRRAMTMQAMKNHATLIPFHAVLDDEFFAA